MVAHYDQHASDPEFPWVVLDVAYQKTAFYVVVAASFGEPMTTHGGTTSMARRKPGRAVTLAPLGIELGTRMVDDPYEPGARLEAVVNLRESPLDRWRARDEIDGAQYAAGERFRSAWERAGIGGAKAFDWTKEFVDGGRLHEPLTDVTRRAAKRLGQAQRELGPYSYRLVVSMIGERRFPSDIAPGDEREAKYISRRVRDALAELAMLWGMVTGPQRRARNGIGGTGS